MSGPLKILLVDSEAERAVMLERRIREIGDAVILRALPGRDLLDSVASAAPDVIVVDLARPERDALADLRRVSADHPRPIVMFVDRDDRSFIEEAIAAGVSSCTVVVAAFPDVQPIVTAAVAIFRRHQQVVAALRQARAVLAERETINRAKHLLMHERGIDEPRAYRWLRRRAMTEGRRIAAIAADLLAGTGEGGTGRP